MTARTWNVQSEDGFLACYHAMVAEVDRYAALLCGADRTAAEDLVQEVYLAAMTSALTPLQLSGLPERERIALVLRYVDDLTVADVAANLGVSVHAAGAHQRLSASCD